MKLKKLIEYMENWAPPGIAWKGDNIGLQIGDRLADISGVLLALDLKEEVVESAVKNNCNLILTHHPFIFTPLKSLDFSKDPKSKIISKLIKKNINLYSAHTNLDFTKHGVNFTLAKKLCLKNIDFFDYQIMNQYKISTFVPAGHLKLISTAVFNAGGGNIGEYSNCGFSLSGQGSYSKNSNKIETPNEVKFEFIVDKWNLNSVINAIKKNHPYEVPAYDIIEVRNENLNYGYGAIGELERDYAPDDFLQHVSEKLNTNNLRFAKGTGQKIRKVVVYGGAGTELVGKAIAQNVDAYVTGDIKYHQFQDAEDKILLIDAGHYETENPVLSEIQTRVKKVFAQNNEKIKVLKYRGDINPINFYNKKTRSKH